MTIIVDKPIKALCLLASGLLVRLALMAAFMEPISGRVEVTTPISSWKRAYEAVHLWNSGLNPYSGNMFHEYPISLQFYKFITSHLNLNLVFAATDIVTASLLSLSAFNQLILNGQDKEIASSKSNKVLLVYLFSPFTIVSCAGMSTSIFTNFLISLTSFIIPMESLRTLACVLCALLACNNLHYATLIIPIFLCIEYCANKRHTSEGNSDNGTTNPSKQTKPYYEDQQFQSSISSSAIIFLTTIVTLFITSYLLMNNSWTFMRHTYMFVLKIQDLTPNIGFFWYLFTEMYDYFLDFFTWAVQINAFIHVIPLSIHLRDNPFLALYAMILTSTITQPYPSLSNVALITSLLPQWSELFPHMRRGLLLCCAGATCISLWPLFWHLWIIQGTANPNFYFGANLAFMLTLTFLLNDLLMANQCIKSKDRQKQFKEEVQASCQ